MRALRALCALMLVAAVPAACGDDTDAVGDGATVDFTMVDTAFQPDTLEVEAGSTVTLAFTNDGAIAHEAVVGDEEFQDEHEAEMTAMAEGEDGDMADMEMDHDEGVEVEPGETAELTYTFEDVGTTYIACHEPGHYEAGMIVEVTVS